MRRFYFLYAIYMAVISAFMWTGSASPKEQIIDIYYVDSDMLRLVSVGTPCGGSAQEQAERVIDILISGKDHNKKIKRMIPDIKGCIGVKVKGNTAYVDIRGEENFPDGRIAEELVVYQIVNSLTSVPGVVKVKFTFDGKTEKNFKGFIDMRETFIPDYYV